MGLANSKSYAEATVADRPDALNPWLKSEIQHGSSTWFEDHVNGNWTKVKGKKKKGKLENGKVSKDESLSNARGPEEHITDENNKNNKNHAGLYGYKLQAKKINKNQVKNKKNKKNYKFKKINKTNNKNDLEIMKLTNIDDFSKKLNHLTIMVEIMNLRLIHVIKHLKKPKINKKKTYKGKNKKMKTKKTTN